MQGLRLLVTLFVFILWACSQPTEYQMGQAVEMGPFAFTVESASEKKPSFSKSRGDKARRYYKTILVDFELDPGRSSGAKVKFDDFLNDTAGETGMFVKPLVKIVDREGRKFDGLVYRVSGREHWRAEFALVVPRRGTKSAQDYLDRQVSDFRLLIENPDRREGQPRQVSIRLR